MSLGKKSNKILWLIALILCIFIGFRPFRIPDAQDYFLRYYEGPLKTNYYEIIKSSSFWRGTYYNMSKPINFLFYFFHNIYVPYQSFVIIIIFLELSIYFIYTRKIFRLWNVVYNEYLLFLMVLLFYSFRYQFIAFAQGVAMCFAIPILYYLIKKKYLSVFFFIWVAICFHIGAFYFIVVIVCYIVFPKVSRKMYVILWLFVGFLSFTKIGYHLGDNCLEFVEYGINKIGSSEPIYKIYGESYAKFHISLSNIVIWLLLGILIGVKNLNIVYWKLININLMSMTITSIMGRWEIIHRFTDFSRMYIPILMIMYVYESKPIIWLPGKKNKSVTLYFVLFLWLMHSLSLLTFI